MDQNPAALLRQGPEGKPLIQKLFLKCSNPEKRVTDRQILNKKIQKWDTNCLVMKKKSSKRVTNRLLLKKIFKKVTNRLISNCLLKFSNSQSSGADLGAGIKAPT